jgi:hypothetical protein
MAGGGEYEKSNRGGWGSGQHRGWAVGLKRWAGGVKSLGRLHMGDCSSVIRSMEQSEDVIM